MPLHRLEVVYFAGDSIVIEESGQFDESLAEVLFKAKGQRVFLIDRHFEDIVAGGGEEGSAIMRQSLPHGASDGGLVCDDVEAQVFGLHWSSPGLLNLHVCPPSTVLDP